MDQLHKLGTFIELYFDYRRRGFRPCDACAYAIFYQWEGNASS